MESTDPFRQLIHTVRSQASALLDRSHRETTEQIAQFSGRAASWADQAGVAFGQVSDEAATAIGSAGRGAADTAARAAERYAQAAGDRLAGVAGRAAHTLGELALRLGDRLTEQSQSRD